MAIYENDETWMWCLSRTGRSSCALTCYVRKLVRQKRRIKHSYHRLTALRLFSWNHPIQKEFKVTHNWCFSLHMILSTLRIIKVWYSIQWLPVFKKQHHLGDRTKHTDLFFQYNRQLFLACIFIKKLFTYAHMIFNLGINFHLNIDDSMI